MSTQEPQQLASPKKGVSRAKNAAGMGIVVHKVKPSKVNRVVKTGEFVLVVSRVTGLQARSINNTKILKKVRAGLPYKSFDELLKAYGGTQKEIAEILSIPISTLTRRKRDGKLHADESDRVVRLAKIRDKVLAMMQGDEQATISWLRTPQDIFGGETPMSYSSTEIGAREVEDLIGRIRHGVFS